MNKNVEPLVSICCLAFNHERYIKQSIEGFLMQQTNFNFEILIHEDCSKDKTADIIREYVAKYPDIIKPIYQIENQYSKGVNVNSKIQFPRAKGNYIAMCEGDDYWTDPLKLQKQVDFMEENKDISLCFHNSEVVFETSTNKEDRGLKIVTENRAFGAHEILKQWVIPTASVLFRKDLLNRRYYDIADNKKFMYGDIILFLSLAERGTLFGQSDFMSVYRRHEGGVTNVELDLKHYNRRIIHLEEIIKVFGLKYKKPLSDLISYTNLNIFLSNLKKGRIKYSNIGRIISNDKMYLLKILKSKLSR